MGSEIFRDPSNALPKDSLKRVQKVIRKDKLDTQDRTFRRVEGEQELVVNEEVFVSNGYTPEPTVKIGNPEEKPADFYRNGEVVVEDVDGEITNVAGGGVTPEAGFQYNLLPRLLEEFDDEQASIRLIGKKQGSDEIVDLIPPYTKFILQSASETYSERNQIVETFGDFYVFFFGQRPTIYNFSGTLINARNASWLNDWKFMYQQFLRGTKSIENKARILLTYGGRQIEGYVLNTSNTTVAETEKGAPFNFQVLLIDEKFIHFSNDFGLVVSDGQLTEATSFLELLTEGPLSQADVDRALSRARAVMERSVNAVLSEQPQADQLEVIENDFGVELETTQSGRLRLPGSNTGIA